MSSSMSEKAYCERFPNFVLISEDFQRIDIHITTTNDIVIRKKAASVFPDFKRNNIKDKNNSIPIKGAIGNTISCNIFIFTLLLYLFTIYAIIDITNNMSKSITSIPGINSFFLIITVDNTANITINATNANNISDNIFILLYYIICACKTLNIYY